MCVCVAVILQYHMLHLFRVTKIVINIFLVLDNSVTYSYHVI